MIKVFCDRCGRECKNGHDRAEIPCHIAEPGPRGYVDQEGNKVSGRVVAFELCHKCANEVNAATFAAIKMQGGAK